MTLRHPVLEISPLNLYTMNNVDSVISSNHYQPVTMDDERILEMMLEKNIINREHLSNRISGAYIDVQNSMNTVKRETLSKLSASTQSQQDIPLELLDQMFAV